MTRLPDIQALQYDMIALIPWISQECTLSYLAEGNKDGVVALITYVPNNQTGTPPPTSDPQWGLSDGGQWKSNNHYPVYAIPGASGFAVMQQLSKYSGNISTVPYSTELLLQLRADPTDYVRMYCNLQTSAKNNLPTLWAFLLIVLGVVLFLVACTSLAMHWYQRHARNRLRRRVAEGEVDLEALGIRRLTVPQEVIDKLPTYVYTVEKEPPIPESPETAQSPRRNSLPSRLTPGLTESTAIGQPHQQSYTQPTCAICLDDFEPRSTTVRELPCRHIYHPECIDQLLLRHSSLCPVCKTKILPKGYCPEVVTNLMVRRERQMRRLAAQGPTVGNQAADPNALPQSPSRRLAVRGRMASFHRQFGRHNLSFAGRRIASAPMTSSSTELARRRPPLSTVNTNTAARPRSPSQTMGDRQERARRRVSAILGHQLMTEDEERERRQNLPKCKSLTSLNASDTHKGFAGRRTVGTIFPGFR